MSPVRPLVSPSPEQAEVGKLLERAVLDHPNREFLRFDGGARSYRETAGRVWAIAEWLIDAGVRPGDSVSVWLPNTEDAVVAWFAINAAGGVYAPLNTAYKGSILEHTINLAGSKMLIVHHELLARLAGLDLTHLELLVVVGQEGEPPVGLGVRNWAEIPSSRATPPRLQQARQPGDDMSLIYTSGTTGPSKAVRCSYTHHYAYGHYLFGEEIGPEDCFYLCLPLFHVAGSCGLYWTLVRGGTVAVVPPFSPRRFSEDVESYGVTIAPIITLMSNLLVDLPPDESEAGNSLRSAYVIPMIPRVHELAQRLGIRFWSGYGMTEIPTLVNTGIDPVDHRSCGRLIDPESYQARIVDEHDLDVPPGEVGELVVRHRLPEALFSGYKGMPEATEEAWRNGWFHTGDAFSRDESGSFYFHDRQKDTIRRRGENISSFEVEKEILSHPAVAEAAVVPVKAENEDEVKAVICFHPDAEIELAELISFLADRLPYFMVPRYVEVMDKLPMGPSMRVQKQELKEAGVTPGTWDRVQDGVILKRERLA